MQEMWVQSLGREDPLEKEMEPTPVFLPGKAHGQRSLVGHSPRDRSRAGHDLAAKWNNQLFPCEAVHGPEALPEPSPWSRLAALCPSTHTHSEGPATRHGGFWRRPNTGQVPTVLPAGPLCLVSSPGVLFMGAQMLVLSFHLGGGRLWLH